MSDLLELVRSLFIGFLVLVIVVVAPVVFMVIQMDRWQCEGYARDTGKQTKYGNAMCFIQDGGQWFAWEEYKHRLVAKGEMKK